jgi:hypothetical protein
MTLFYRCRRRWQHALLSSMVILSAALRMPIFGRQKCKRHGNRRCIAGNSIPVRKPPLVLRMQKWPLKRQGGWLNSLPLSPPLESLVFWAKVMIILLLWIPDGKAMGRGSFSPWRSPTVGSNIPIDTGQCPREDSYLADRSHEIVRRRAAQIDRSIVVMRYNGVGSPGGSEESIGIH